MKNKRYLFCLMMLLLTYVIAGCSLAKEDAETNVKDQLVGALVTTESLDLYDMDAFFTDHISGIMDGEEIALSDDEKYKQRLYATIDKNGSEDCRDWDISFDVDGLLCIVQNYSSEDHGNYIAPYYDDGICDLNTNINVTDTMNEIVITASTYVMPKQEDDGLFVQFYLNPVYKTADNQFYVMDGTAGSISSVSGTNPTLSQHISEEYNVVVDGEEKTEKLEIKISMTAASEPNKITIIQMDEADKVIKKDEYNPNQVPSSIKAEKDTAYFIVKTDSTDSEGNAIVKRELFPYEQDGDETIQTYYLLKEEYLAKKIIEVDWNKEGQ